MRRVAAVALVARVSAPMGGASGFRRGHGHAVAAVVLSGGRLLGGRFMSMRGSRCLQKSGTSARRGGCHSGVLCLRWNLGRSWRGVGGIRRMGSSHGLNAMLKHLEANHPVKAEDGDS